MKRIFYTFSLSLFTLAWMLSPLFFSSCNSDQSDYKLQFYTNEYPPFNYTEDGELKGLGTDFLYRLSGCLEFTPNISVGTWTESYQATLDNPNGVLYSAVLNADRKDKFKWAGPYAEVEWSFYRNSQSSVSVDNLEEAKLVGSIGVLEDNTMHQFLVQHGFSNFTFCIDQMDAVQKLLNGEIDLYPATYIPLKASLENLGSNIYAVTNELPLLTEMIYYAFNLSVSDEIVADFQEAIDRNKTNGFLTQLNQEYFNHRNVPDVLLIYTEQYPPLSFRNEQGVIDGFGTDVVKEILDRRGEYFDIKLTTWSNAYQMALLNPNFCLFTMDKTEERADLFHWVGSIGTNTSSFYVKSESSLEINSLDDAKNLNSIGVVDSWFSTQYLLSEGFTNLQTFATPSELTTNLMNGQVECVVVSNITFPSILHELNYSIQDVKPVFELMSSDFYISFSKSTSAEMVNQWQSTLDAMKQDGTFQFIQEKWSLGSER